MILLSLDPPTPFKSNFNYPNTIFSNIFCLQYKHKFPRTMSKIHAISPHSLSVVYCHPHKIILPVTSHCVSWAQPFCPPRTCSSMFSLPIFLLSSTACNEPHPMGFPSVDLFLLSIFMLITKALKDFPLGSIVSCLSFCEPHILLYLQLTTEVIILHTPMIDRK